MSPAKTELCKLTISELVAVNRCILVFVPGMGEIESVKESLRIEYPEMQVPCGAGSVELDIVTLHSELPPEEEERAFGSLEGKYRVILATNMAESSITLPDVDYVLDFGLHRELTVCCCLILLEDRHLFSTYTTPLALSVHVDRSIEQKFAHFVSDLVFPSIYDPA